LPVQIIAAGPRAWSSFGGSRGVGLQIAELASAQGARVLAAARTERDLDSLASRGVDILALDATADAAPKTVFQAEKPDLLVICGGATPRSLPIPELSWTDFSVNEAEDAVQETMLRAWRGFDDFEARASIKNWLYRIATNVALSMVTSRAARGRTMPDRLDAPSTNPPQGRPDVDTLWVEPYPDAELANLPDTAAGPDAR
jgi:NAD(P)-dependent dehydrogenase (short-subunit alcohol dehydrogenase family)